MRIDAIAVQYGVSRSTLFAVMGGKRLPTPPVLEALVLAWGGDPVEWMTRRSETEREIERLRLRDDRPPKDPRRQTRRHQRPLEAVSTDFEWRGAVGEVPLSEPASSEVLARDSGGGEKLDRGDESATVVVRAEDALSGMSGGRLIRILVHDEPALGVETLWDRLRVEAGYPTLRDIAYATHLPQRVVAKVLRDESDSRSDIEAVYVALWDRRYYLTRQLAQPSPPGEEQNFPPPL
jgi:hypothetical protein